MNGINIQVNTLIDAMIESEPCLFHNKESNLMVSSSPSQDADPVAVRYVAPLRRTDDGIATTDDADHFGTYNDRT